MSKKIIIIDDEQDIVTVAAFRLKKLGYDVITADNGKTGLEMIVNEKPDLIFLDLLMPDMDGYEVCKRLKKDDNLKDIPVILFTAVEDSRVNSALKETGAEGFLVKPYEPAQLINVIDEHIK